MQSVAVAKDKIKKIRRGQSSSRHEPPILEDDDPPPYSENPPFNPFYNDLVHNVSAPLDGHDMSRGSLDGSRSQLYQDQRLRRRSEGFRDAEFGISPVYPVLSNISCDPSPSYHTRDTDTTADCAAKYLDNLNLKPHK